MQTKQATETALTPNALIAELGRIGHGELNGYVPIMRRVTVENPELAAHFLSWNKLNGQVRDSLVALPVITLAVPQFNDAELIDNSLAHMASLPLRDFMRALRFAKQVGVGPAGRMRTLKRLVLRYLRTLEADQNKWKRIALQHRDSLRECYAMFHVKPSSDFQNAVIYGRALDKSKMELPHGTAFHSLDNLRKMPPLEAAGEIMRHRFPFMAVQKAFGGLPKDPDILVATIARMTPTELTTNTKALMARGLKTDGKIKAAYEEALGRKDKPGRGPANVLKATTAMEVIEDEGIKAKLQVKQERALDAMSVEGDWLVLADKSGSMQSAIETARLVSGTLSRLAKGRVSLIFFDIVPYYYDATGKTYEEILETTKRVQAGGGTSIGCGLLQAIQKNLPIDGIVVVSDGAENNAPLFAQQYAALVQAIGKQPPVYFFHVRGSEGPVNEARFGASMKAQGFDLQEIDIRDKEIDKYSVVNLVGSLHTQHYGLLEAIMDTPLLTLDDVLKPLKVEEAVV
jgi:hypothetical protein